MTDLVALLFFAVERTVQIIQVIPFTRTIIEATCFWVHRAEDRTVPRWPQLRLMGWRSEAWMDGYLLAVMIIYPLGANGSLCLSGHTGDFRFLYFNSSTSSIELLHYKFPWRHYSLQVSNLKGSSLRNASLHRWRLCLWTFIVSFSGEVKHRQLFKYWWRKLG